MSARLQLGFNDAGGTDVHNAISYSWVSGDNDAACTVFVKSRIPVIKACVISTQVQLYWQLKPSAVTVVKLKVFAVTVLCSSVLEGGCGAKHLGAHMHEDLVSQQSQANDLFTSVDFVWLWWLMLPVAVNLKPVNATWYHFCLCIMLCMPCDTMQDKLSGGDSCISVCLLAASG